jgi:hypothetical protein
MVLNPLFFLRFYLRVEVLRCMNALELISCWGFRTYYSQSKQARILEFDLSFTRSGIYKQLLCVHNGPNFLVEAQRMMMAQICYQGARGHHHFRLHSEMREKCRQKMLTAGLASAYCACYMCICSGWFVRSRPSSHEHSHPLHPRRYTSREREREIGR